MSMASLGRPAVVVTFILTCWGGTSGLGVSPSGLAWAAPPLASSVLASSAGAGNHGQPGMVQQAIAYEGEANTIQQTAGTSSPGESISSSVKAGVQKMGDMLTPDAPPKTSIAPTSLAKESKPTAQLHVAVARLHESKGNLEEAERQYQEALKLTPDYLDAQVGMGRLRDRQRQPAEALQWYQKAVKAHPKEPSAYNDLGLCYARRRMFPQSVEALEQAVRLQPTKPLYRNNLAMVLVEKGDNDAAFTQLVSVHSEAVACYNLGYLVYKKGQYELASKLFAKAAARDPSLTQAQIWAQQAQAAAVGHAGMEKATAAGPTRDLVPAEAPIPAAGPTLMPANAQPSSPPPTLQARRPEPLRRSTRQLPPTSVPREPGRAEELAPAPTSPASETQMAPLPPDLLAEPQPLPPVDR